MAHAIVNPDREQLIQCPYDPVHMISQMRFPYHLIKCRKNHDGAEYMQCPYDAKHVIQKNQFQEHVQHCDKKAIIEPQLVLADPCEALVIPESNAAEIQDVLSNDWDIEAPSAAFHHRSKKPVTQTAHNTFNSIGNANGFKRDIQRDMQRGDLQSNAHNAQYACSSKSNGHIPPRKPELRAPYTSSSGSKQYSETYDHQKSFGRGRAMLRGNSDMSLMTASIGPSSYRKATEGPEMIDAYNPPPMASFGRGRGVMSLNPPQKLRKPGSMGNRKKENMKPDNRPSNLGSHHNGTSYGHHNMTRESLEHHKNKLLKKHREISSLMERQDQGYALERNQIEKIESMKGLEEELHEVCSKLDRM